LNDEEYSIVTKNKMFIMLRIAASRPVVSLLYYWVHCLPRSEPCSATGNDEE